MEEDLDDADRDWHPIWLDTDRDFVDHRTKQAEAFNDLLTQHLPLEVLWWTCDEFGWTFQLSNAIIQLSNEEFEPLRISASSETMSRKFLDGMRAELRLMLEECFGLGWNPTEFMIALLQLVEAAVHWQHAWMAACSVEVNRNLSHQKTSPNIRRGRNHGWDARDTKDWASVLDNPDGVNLLTVQDTALSLLGDTIVNICSKVKDDLRILHVEPVFRNDLVSRFLHAKNSILRHLLKMPYDALRKSVPARAIRPGSTNDTKEMLAEELAKPSITFHGAPRHVIESIVRYGFVIPGQQIGETGNALEVRCGSSFGKGVYSSPDPMYASLYLDYQGGKPGAAQPKDVPGMRLIVCATLMGRALTVTRDEAWRKTELMSDNAHSHVSPNGLEYIVFNAAQIIPCYVLHLDYGAEQARKEFETAAANFDDFFQRRKTQKNRNKWVVEEELWPAEIEQKKQALKAAAAKWFPYGYGPAQGTNFVIEEIAEVSDDEETYGAFQYQRIEQDNEIRKGQSHAGASWFDEYQTVRKMKAELALR